MSILIDGALHRIDPYTRDWLDAHGFRFGQPYFMPDAVEVTSAGALVAEVAAGNNVVARQPITAFSTVAFTNLTRPSYTGTGDTVAGSRDIHNVSASGTLTVGMRYVGVGARVEHPDGYTDGGIPFGCRITAIAGTTVTISKPAKENATGARFVAAKDVHIGTEGDGLIPAIHLDGSTWISISARIKSIRIDGANFGWLDNCRIGGSGPSGRIYDQLLFIPNDTSDLLITDNDIGWTLADNSGNTGYGIRLGSTLDRMAVVGNWVHDTAADCLQGLGSGVDQVFDRNELGPGGANPDSDEHTDLIQSVFNGPGCRVTNNYIHHQGYFDGAPTGGSGATYLHGDDVPSSPAFEDGDMLYANNLVAYSRGRVEVGGLGSGGNRRSRLTVRGNTFYDLGRRRDDPGFGGFAGFEWDVNSTNAINTVERNIFLDVDDGIVLDPAQIGVTVNWTNNINGQLGRVNFDDQMNAVGPEVNPAGEDPIGYRKPLGVHW